MTSGQTLQKQREKQKHTIKTMTEKARVEYRNFYCVHVIITLCLSFMREKKMLILIQKIQNWSASCSCQEAKVTFKRG